MPAWLHILSIVFLLFGFACAIIIVADEIKHPQQMWIMNAVWPLTALFGTALALRFYYRHGRATRGHGGKEAPFPIAVAKGTTHCGAGCTLGDTIAEWLAVLVPGVAVWFGWQSVFADKIFAIWVLDYIFAFVIGIVFQYFTIVPMRGLAPVEGLIAALKVDFLSLTAWQIGMYGFMAFAQFYLFGHLLGTRADVASPEFWFTMQIAMMAGFCTSYPVNWWLIRSGIKERM